MISTIRKLPKAVIFLSIASLFGDIASETIYPILPIFLTQALGISALSLGVLEGMAEAIASLMKLVSGYIADKTRKPYPLVFLGYSVSLCRSLIGLATSPWHVFAVRFSDRLGKGIRTAPRDAWLADYTTPQTRGKIFGFHRAMDNVGATIAPLLASAYLYFFPGAYRSLFLWTLIPGLLVIYFIFRAREANRDLEIQPKNMVKINFRAAAQLPRNFWYLLFVILLFTLGNSADAFLILRLKDIGVPIYLIPALWSALNLVKVLSSIWGGSFSDRVGAKTSVALGWAIYALAYFSFASVTDPLLISIIFITYGIFFGLSEAPEKSLVTAMAPAHLRGTAFGFYHLICGVGLMPASIICGWLWKDYGPSTALLFGSSMAVISLLMLLPLQSQERAHQN